MTTTRSDVHLKLSLLGSSDDPAELMVRGPVRICPADRTQLEMQFGFRHPNRSDPVKLGYQWLPFASFGYYPQHTVFFGETIRFPDERYSNFPKPVPTTDFHVPNGTLLALDHPVDSFDIEILNKVQTHNFVDWHQKPPTTVNAAEIARFYLTPVSLIARELLKIDHSREKALRQIFNPERTFWIEDDVLHIAPEYGFLSRSGALQAALIVMCGDIERYWSKTISRFRKCHVEGTPLEFREVFPDEAGNLSVVTRDRVITDNDTGQIRSVIEFHRIVQDRRNVRARDVIVELPKWADHGLIEDLNDGADIAEQLAIPRERSLIDRLLKRQFGAGAHAVNYVIAAHTISEAFPSLASIKLQYERRRGPFVSAQKSFQEILNRVDGFSFGKAGRSGAAAHLRHVTGDVPIHREIDFDRFIAPPIDCSPAAVQPFDPHKMNGQMRAFVFAAHLLQERGQVRSNLPASVPDGDASVNALIFGDQWGSWGRVTGRPFNRRALVLPIVVHDQLFWAVEIECVAKYEKLALGIVQPLVDLPAEQFLDYYLAHVARRMGGNPGTGMVAAPFPTGEFADANVTSLKHTRSRLLAFNLAQALVSKCEWLIERRRLLSS